MSADQQQIPMLSLC